MRGSIKKTIRYVKQNPSDVQNPSESLKIINFLEYEIKAVLRFRLYRIFKNSLTENTEFPILHQVFLMKVPFHDEDDATRC